MIYYVDVRFEVETDTQQEAIDIVTREVNEIFDARYAYRDVIMTPPYVIAVTSADTIEEAECDLEELDSIDTVTEESIEAINLFDLYRAVRNEVKL